MQSPVADELYREFLKTFQQFHDPVGLADSALLASPLVSASRQRHAGLLPYQALQAVFAEVLTLLEAENPDYADLLRGRFWEGKQIEEMLTLERPLPMSRRTFSNYQRNAIHAFAFLFAQTEGNQQRQSLVAAAFKPAEPPPNPTALPHVLPSSASSTPTRQEWQPTLLLPSPPKRSWFWGLLLLFPLVGVGLLNRGIVPNFWPFATTEPLFTDNFEAGASQWSANSDKWSIQVDEQGNHAYCVNTGGGYTNSLAGSASWQDYTLELDLKIVNSAPRGSANIFWRVSAQTIPLYLLDIYAHQEGGMALARESPAYSKLDQTHSGLPLAEWTHLRIEVTGAQMQVFVGESTIPILQATDPNPIERGGIGLSAGFSQSAPMNRWEVCFDNIEVTRR